MRKLLSAVLLFSIFLTSCGNEDQPTSDPAPAVKSVPRLSYSILATLPHDTAYFTEGLEFYNNTLIESTGLNGKSKLLAIDPATNKVLRSVSLDPAYFGEGVTILNDTAYQLTWQEHVVFVYHARDFKKIRELPFNGQGWGLTNDGKNLIASNGSSDLYFYQPGTFKLLNSISVSEAGSVVPNINELEYINGFIYANQWQRDLVYKIDPKTGEVVGKIDLSDLASRERASNPVAEVLNGIAYNPATKKIYVTGKNWKTMYEISIGQ